MARKPRTPRTTATSTATTTTTATTATTTPPTATTATTTTTEPTMPTVTATTATTATEPTTTEPTATTPATTTTTAMVPATTPTPGTYAAGILRALLAGDELALDPESVALAISALESPMVATTTTAATTTTPRVLREAPEARAAAVANGLPTRKIWRTKAYGPLLVGACNAAGGAVVRDTRESYPASDVWAGQKVSDALAFVVATYPEFTRANATPEALARIAADGVAR